MRILQISFILILLLSSCNNSNQEIPNVLTREQMVDILTDVALTEAKLAYEKKTILEAENLTEKYYEPIFSKYNISKEEFEESMFYYKQDIIELDNIYSDVITKLNKIQSEFVANQTKQDSIDIVEDLESK